MDRTGTPAGQRRNAPPARRGGDIGHRGFVRPIAEAGARATGALLGVVQREEFDTLAAGPGSSRRRLRLPPARLRPLHGGLRHRRPHRGETVAGRPRRVGTPLKHAVTRLIQGAPRIFRAGSLSHHSVTAVLVEPDKKRLWMSVTVAESNGRPLRLLLATGDGPRGAAVTFAWWTRRRPS